MLHVRKNILFGLTGGLVFSLLALLTVSSGLAGNMIITEPEAIREAADTAMNSIQTGDWNTLEEMVSGGTGLTPITGEPGSPEHRIYETFRQSLQWTCEDSFSVQGHYVTQKLTITCLDIRSAAHSMAAVVADSHNEAATRQQLQTAAHQVLEGELPLIQREVTLTFRREQHRWMIVPDHGLLVLLSGFTTH